MTKKERAILARLINTMQNDLPALEDCGCEEDGSECDFHRCNRRLGDFTAGWSLKDIAEAEKMEDL